ncbi:exodeoxyribonuclease VII large subunit [uncultured Clostridium sp.]|uniref:exodeoxyribonuclease VII large subunit n=2 Tax=uncultured Clostridium sp. TaxID=59620 RepID=UPI0026111C99|nr:exodeoxyribonuclease VII large subunit [uncultured Clostridium sp.]
MRIKTLTVSEVNNYIKKILDNDFILNNLSVRGEISNLKYHSSGHVYFSLKDDNSKINCIMFKNKSLELDIILKEGMSVIVSGRASVYSVNGTFQIYCDNISQEGLGELHIKFEKLKEKLSREGYFNEEFKKPLPKNPYGVGVVTSETGAAIQDIINVIRRRNTKVDIILYPAIVQGDGAYKTIIKGIKYFNKKKSVDVIIIGRGGGSMEELWNFNEELLAYSIFKSEIPIISAVGHEIDFTISDFVSDCRAATPSQAAEIAVPLEESQYNEVSDYEKRLNIIVSDRFKEEKQRVKNLEKILNLNSPNNKIVNSYLEIDNIKEKIEKIIEYKIKNNKEKIFSLNNILNANNPLNILGKGYAIIENNEGKIIKSKEEFKEITEIKISMEDGYVKGSFTQVERGGFCYGKERKL